MIRWIGSSPAGRKTVRSAACRSTIDCRERCNAAMSRLPRSVRILATLKTVESACSWAKNHWVSCGNESGASSRGVDFARGAAAARRASSASAPGSSEWCNVRHRYSAPASSRSSSAATPATVGVSKKAISGRSTWSCARRRATARVASTESPPRAKKFREHPARHVARISIHVAPTISSVGEVGAVVSPEITGTSATTPSSSARPRR